MSEPVLIRGMGLAGCLLGHALEARGIPVHIVDAAWSGAASPKAAGLMNPLAGRALKPAPEWDTFHTQARHSYRRLERKLERSFLFERIYWTLFRNPEEAAQWRGLLNDPERSRFLDQSIQNNATPLPFQDGCGGMAVVGGSQVHIAKLLDASRSYWTQKGCFETASLAPEAIQALPDGRWQWAKRSYRAVVCCGGAMDHNTPWWAFLGIRPNAGERLMLKLEEPRMPEAAEPPQGWPWVVRKAGLLAPMHLHTGQAPEDGDVATEQVQRNRVWWLGSANRWDTMDHHPTEAGRAQLHRMAKGMLHGAFGVLDHGVGIRATMPDRRPVVGPHPRLPNLWCFNGLGTKGSLWGPWHAEALARALQQQIAAPGSGGATAVAEGPIPAQETPYRPPQPGTVPRLLEACLPARFWP